MRRFERTRNEKGAAAVEFGLVALILVTLLLGIIQFGIWFWAWEVGGHAAREGARHAAVYPCDSAGTKSTVVDRLAGAPTSGTPTVSVTLNPSSPKVGDEVTIAIGFTTLDLGFFPGFTGNVAKSATSRIENVPPGGC